jgi:aldose sugar dehydrogenase
MRTTIATLVLLLAPAPAFAAEPAAAYAIETVAEGLDHPWSLAFLPDGRMLVTERAGRLRVIENGRLAPTPVAGMPPVYVDRQGGLFEVLPARDFAKSRVIYLSFAHGDKRANATRVVRARLGAQGLEDVQPIFTAQPLKDTPAHFGGRMAWLPDGTLMLTLGDGFEYREEAQNLGKHLGKLVRINADGSVPKNNPFTGRDGVLPEIYSYGHRNAQGIVYDEQAKRLYVHEHGPRGGDELNVIEPARNYGWPVITYGLDYSGAVISPFKEKPGMEQPFVQWTPSVAPAGMTQYTGKLFPQWRGDLLVSTLVEKSVRRVDLEGGKVVGQEVLFKEIGARLRDVRQGPEGAVYLLTDDDRGRVLKVVPGKS